MTDMAGIDALVFGFADFKGRQSGGGIHTAEVVLRLPKFGLEVAYVPYLSVLLSAINDYSIADIYVKTLKIMERRSVAVPNIVHELLSQAINEYDGDDKRRMANASQGNISSLLKPFKDVASPTISHLIRLLHLDLSGVSSRLWPVAKKFGDIILEELGNVKAVINANTAPSEFPLIAEELAKPIYQVFQSNPTEVCLAIFNSAKRMGVGNMLMRLTTASFDLTSCLRRADSFYSYYLRLADKVKLNAVWINPITYLRFRRYGTAIGKKFSKAFRKNYLIYPGNAMCREALTKASYRKSNYLLFGTRLEPLKGAYDLPLILNSLKDKSDIKVLVTANINNTNSLLVRKLMESYPNIRFTGFIEDRELLCDIYAKAKALIYPSHSDTYSLAILDALGSATPVVAYKIPELTYIYRRVKAVRFVSEFDYRAFSGALARMAELDDTSELFEDETTKEFINLHSSWDNVAEQYARILGHDN